MIRRIVIFLVRKKLGLRLYERFQFANQKTDNKYYFTNTHVIKIENHKHLHSGVSLNWLLDDECEIEKLA